MTPDEPSPLPIPCDPDPEKNLAETGQNGTFGDIDPSYELSAPQCLSGIRMLLGLNLRGLRRRWVVWVWARRGNDIYIEKSHGPFTPLAGRR